MTDSALVYIYKKIVMYKEIESFWIIFILQETQTNTLFIRHKCPMWQRFGTSKNIAATIKMQKKTKLKRN